MQVYEYFKHFTYFYYKTIVPTTKYDMNEATIRVHDKNNKTIKEISFKFKDIAKKDVPSGKLILSEKDQKTLEGKFMEVFAELNFY
jgi:hypothetical protein